LGARLVLVDKEKDDRRGNKMHQKVRAGLKYRSKPRGIVKFIKHFHSPKEKEESCIGETKAERHENKRGNIDKKEDRRG